MCVTTCSSSPDSCCSLLFIHNFSITLWINDSKLVIEHWIQKLFKKNKSLGINKGKFAHYWHSLKIILEVLLFKSLWKIDVHHVEGGYKN